MTYEAQLAVIHEGGTIEALDGGIEFKNCDSLVLIAAAGTDYVMDYSKGYRGEHPHARIDNRIVAASGKNYEALKAAHLADYRALFSRVKIDVGGTSADRLALPTDKRKVLLAERGGDPDLEELLFQPVDFLLLLFRPLRSASRFSSQKVYVYSFCLEYLAPRCCSPPVKRECRIMTLMPENSRLLWHLEC